MRQLRLLAATTAMMQMAPYNKRDFRDVCGAMSERMQRARIDCVSCGFCAAVMRQSDAQRLCM
jgi:hypothetical protein